VSRIKLITLDLDNTLWDVDSIIVKAEAEMIRWLQDRIPESVAHYQGDNLVQIRSRVWQAFQHKSHDLSFMRTEVLYEVIKRTGMPSNEARRCAQQAFDVFFEGRNRVEFFPGALDMLDTLSNRFVIYALTNGNADIEHAGLSGFVAGAYSAADVGVRKPHPDMFHAPLTALSLHPRQAIHIGDHLVDDVQGADDVGMFSIWVNRTEQTRQAQDANPTREVADLHEVAGAVADINSA